MFCNDLSFLYYLETDSYFEETFLIVKVKKSAAKKIKSQKKDKLPAKSNNKLKPIDYILLASFFAFIAVVTSFKIFLDDDVFWHLSTGRFIVQNGYIPSADVFGFMTSGTKWIPFEWGWDVTTYLVYNIAGFYSLSIFRTLIVMAAFAIIIYVLWRNEISLSLIVLFSVLLVFSSLGRFSIRPQVVTYLFFILILYIFYRFKNNYKGKKSFAVILPVIFLLWANMHMGVLLGLAVFGIFVVSEEIEYFFIRKKTKPDEDKIKNKYLIYSFILSIIALLINPHFIETYLYALRHSEMQMLEEINEWKSPFSDPAVSFYYVKIYIFFLFTGVIILYYSAKKKELFPALLYVVIGIYTVRGLRFISDYMFIIFVFWMVALGFLFRKTSINNTLNKLPVKAVITLLLVFLIVKASDDSLYKDYLNNHFRETGLAVNDRYFPKAMFDFIKKENIDKIGSKPFNNLKIGGYFIWNFPESKNFIDSRNLSDKVYAVYKDIDLKKPGFGNLLEKSGIDYVIYSTPYLTINASEIRRNIVSYLSTDTADWKLIYWDDISFLFVRNLPKFGSLINKYEYKYVSPYYFIFNREYLNQGYKTDRPEVISELKRKQSEEPNGILINDISYYLNLLH